MSNDESLDAKLESAFGDDRSALQFTRLMISKAIEAKARFNEAKPGGRDRTRAAGDMLFHMLNAAAVFLGDEAMAHIYGVDAEEDDRAAQLATLWFRLGAAELLFKDVADPKSASSITALRAELLAVSGGDKPRLTATIGKRRVPVRVDLLRLRALGWEVYLRRHHGMAAGVAQRMICDGFGKTWIRVHQWKAELAGALGTQTVKDFLEAAETGFDLHYSVAVDALGVEGAVKADGQALVAEQKMQGAND